MPKLTKQTPTMRKVVRQIQRWLKTNDYESAYQFRLHKTDYTDRYGRGVALCRTGVVTASGGGAIIDHWTEFDVESLRRFLKSAQTLKGGKLNV